MSMGLCSGNLMKTGSTASCNFIYRLDQDVIYYRTGTIPTSTEKATTSEGSIGSASKAAVETLKVVVTYGSGTGGGTVAYTTGKGNTGSFTSGWTSRLDVTEGLYFAAIAGDAGEEYGLNYVAIGGTPRTRKRKERFWPRTSARPRR